MKFDEHALELSIIELFKDEGYKYIKGSEIDREKSAVLLDADLRQYISERYKAEKITKGEVDAIINKLHTISGSLYEANKTFMRLLTDGFIFTCHDRSQKDIYINLINYEEPNKNIFKIVNQVEILGYEQTRIPDAILYINGLPLVVFEFKTASNENTTIMDAVKRLKQAFGLCTASEDITDAERDRIHFYIAVRSILFKLTKGNAPDISQMNAHVQKMVEDAICSDGIEELFSTGKNAAVDLFSEEYLLKISQIKFPNTKIKLLQKLLANAIEEFKKVNKIKAMEFFERLQNVVDSYNNRRSDEAFANEVLDDVVNQLADLLQQLKDEKNSFEGMGIDFEEKAFYDILKSVAKKFEYPKDKMIFLSKEIKKIVDDKSKYINWSSREDIKAELKTDIIIVLDDNGYPPVTIDDVYKDVLEQA